MSEESSNNSTEENKTGESQESVVEKETSTPTKKRRRFFNRRNGLIALILSASLFIILALVGTVTYRYGVVDNYVKDQFRAALSDMGVVFDADAFRLTVNPLQLTLENATFNNKKTGDKIFRIGSARIGMTVTDLYQLQFERHIDVNSTDVDDLEAWVYFDENGNSNFEGLVMTPEKAIKFNFASNNVALRNSVVHFNESTRKISGDAKNVQFFLTPIAQVSPEEVLRYKFDFKSTESTFTYDESKVDPIDIKANGIVNSELAEVNELRITAPLGESVLSGKVKNYQTLEYDLKIKSTIDLTQTSNIFPLGTSVTGIGNFEGKVTGEAENYKIEGEIVSENLAAANIRLRALKVNATVDGEGSMYNANGKAVAELLTFEDFRIEYPQLIGNIRGTGTDFRWVGELQAAAAKSPLGTIGGLYISDAYAEYKDNLLIATLGNFRARKFSNDNVNLESIQTRNIKIISRDGATDVTIPNVTASRLDVEGATLEGINISGAKVKNRNGETNVTAGNIRARNVETAAAKLGDVTAKGVTVNNRRGSTNVRAGSVTAGKVQTEQADLGDVTASGVTVNNRDGSTDVTVDKVRAGKVTTDGANIKGVTANGVKVNNRKGLTNVTARYLQTDGVDTNAAKIGNVKASGVTVNINGDTTKITSNSVQIAKVNTEAAILGNLNIAGVRLTVRQGRIEGTTGDFNAGDVFLTKNSGLPDGGKLNNVAVYKPVFVLEPSGRYRASLDMSLGGGVLGSVTLGKATASVVAENDQVAVNNLSAEVMEGSITGNATIALNNSKRSDIKADFVNLDIGKLLALQGGRVIPIEGNTTGKVDLSFNGTDFKKASGTLNADILAKAGRVGDEGEDGEDFIPLTGRVAVTATNGLFGVDYANLQTDKTNLNATGSFDLSGSNSDLNVALNSSDASEIIRIIKTLNFSPTIEEQLDTYQANFAGNFVFNGNIKGNLSDPLIDGRASLDSLILRGKDLGSLATNVFVSPNGIELREGVLQERGGGNIAFSVNAPSIGTNNISVQAKLNNISVGNLLSALPISSLPDGLKNLSAQASGNLDLRGLPNQMQGEANIFAKDGSVNGQTFDTLEAKAVFDGNLVNLETFNAKFANGSLNAKGFYRTDSTQFDFDVNGADIPVSRVLAFFPKNDSIPDVEGNIDLTAKATGRSADSTTYDVNFKGVGQNIIINNNSFGDVNFEGKTENQLLTTDLVTSFQGQTQNISATLNFADPDLPLRAETTFNQTRLAPFIAIFRKPETDSVAIGGTATGRVLLQGNLSQINSNGIREFTKDNLSGTANFTQFDLQIDETPLIATNPINIKFDTNAVEFVGEARFSGGGSNLVVSGAKALTENGSNNLAVDGKINLKILNALSENIFFSGLADVAVRLTGPNKTARLNGTGQLQNGSVSTFVGSQRISFERLKGNVLFTTNQVQIEQVTGFLGGGRVTASGGILLDGLALQRFRVDVRGNNITAPLPKDFITTGNAEIQISGRREGKNVNTFIQGQFIASRSVYRKDIDLADLLSGRGSASLSTGAGSSDSSELGAINLDVRIIGRNAFVVRNNLADLTASADLRVTGDVDFPQVSGRITADSGTLFFRDNRYEIQRGVLTFPPNTTGIEPIINLQAETEIKGYQIFLNLNGSLTDTETLNAVLRSNPSLPQNDVVSLVTTGNLADSDSGLGGSGGVNTVAGVLTDEIINKPLSRATDKLFGLNRFELDPIVSGQRGNPTARLTVGRQINKNLLVTYSTNLSEDQNQVLALEYRVSNRLSFVAQYEQRSLSNVTQNRNTFSFEVRLRKRF